VVQFKLELTRRFLLGRVGRCGRLKGSVGVRNKETH